jgi:hypothetical protein
MITVLLRVCHVHGFDINCSNSSYFFNNHLDDLFNPLQEIKVRIRAFGIMKIEHDGEDLE